VQCQPFAFLLQIRCNRLVRSVGCHNITELHHTATLAANAPDLAAIWLSHLLSGQAFAFLGHVTNFAIHSLNSSHNLKTISPYGQRPCDAPLSSYWLKTHFDLLLGQAFAFLGHVTNFAIHSLNSPHNFETITPYGPRPCDAPLSSYWRKTHFDLIFGHPGHVTEN
jgi:serine/threonine protein kinase HipA of HipAB toxin-antitoxin module